MKIGIVCFNLFIAGGARLIFNLAHILQEKGHKVVIYTPQFEAADYGELARGLDIRVVKTATPITYFKSKKPGNVLAWLNVRNANVFNQTHSEKTF